MKQKFKIEFIESQKYVVDVEANNEKQAIRLAQEKWSEIISFGEAHYYEDGDIETEVGNIYNITFTDDPFNN